MALVLFPNYHCAWWLAHPAFGGFERDALCLMVSTAFAEVEGNTPATYGEVSDGRVFNFFPLIMLKTMHMDNGLSKTQFY